VEGVLHRLVDDRAPQTCFRRPVQLRGAHGYAAPKPCVGKSEFSLVYLLGGYDVVWMPARSERHAWPVVRMLRAL
jgi:hypothetical protein